MFPLLYHAHHLLHLDDLPFWLRMAGRHPGPVLELGCGTGRVLLMLARSGHHVIGLDRDAAMLSVLQSQVTPEIQPYLSIIQADICRFHLARNFNLILLPCNTYSSLPAPARLAALACIRRHLSPQGIFIASIPNPALLLALPRNSAPRLEEVFGHPIDGEPVQVSSAWERTAEEFIIHWYYDHLAPDGRVERHCEEIHHQLASIEEYRTEFLSMGFTRLETLGDFDGSAWDTRSTQVIFLAYP